MFVYLKLPASPIRKGSRRKLTMTLSHDPNKTNTKIPNLSLFSPSSSKLISDKVFQLRFNFQSSTWLIFPIWNDSLFVCRESRATLSGADNFCDVWSRPMPRYCRRAAHLHPTKAKRYELRAGKGWRAVQDVQYRRNNNHKRLFRWYFGNWCRYWSYDSTAAVN